MSKDEQPAKHYLHAVTSLELRSWRKFPKFFRLTQQVRRAMDGMPGLVASGFRVKPRPGKLWRIQFQTLSIWENRTAMGRLMARPEHREASRQFSDVGADSSVTSTWFSPEPKLDWKEAERQLVENPVYPSMNRTLSRERTEVAGGSGEVR